MTIGIDIGSTTTKAIVVDHEDIIIKAKTRAEDPLTAATGIIGKITQENNLHINDIKKIIVTGVGSSGIKNNIFDIETERIDEISAIGRGGVFLAGIDPIMIVNIGTGTVIVEYDHGESRHFGGSGVGGGTIIGLSKALLNITGFSEIMDLASKGDASRVDLQIQDIVSETISFLGKDATAANFGKMEEGASREDIASALINMVYQVIGMLAVFAGRAEKMDKVILTGNGSNNMLGRKVLEAITAMYGIEFIYTQDAEYATAIGAALSNYPHHVTYKVS
ncbi:MAG: BadF/BadG/BcrA/BcrD ATPase family protein [Rectinema sp.]|jgi:type II pantothenate kinase|uniref:Type II pantothenate kinase (Pantothenic acid kinase)(PanK-II) n=1 Tax=uncultured spirochete TaxID=156406 RepID=A0A3P3XPU9_9SPIR|nr:Type II pantothenate kinase (Pantothenic acid kinase)(PanK-II) [uncultured spirochete]